MALCLFQTASAHRKATYRRASLQYDYLHGGVLEQVPALLVSEDGLAHGVGADVAAQQRCVSVGLQATAINCQAQQEIAYSVGCSQISNSAGLPT